MIINFNDIKIKTSPMVYTPGEDTFFVEDVLKKELTKNIQPVNVNNILEVGCGSGYLLIVLVKLCPKSKFVAIDINTHALQITLENINLNGLDQKSIELIHSDLFTKVKSKLFDIIIFNPPYLPTENKFAELNDNNIVNLAWEGGDKIIKAFLLSVENFLSRDGKIIILLSNYQVKNDRPEDYIKQANKNLMVKASYKKILFLETLYIVILMKNNQTIE